MLKLPTARPLFLFLSCNLFLGGFGLPRCFSQPAAASHEQNPKSRNNFSITKFYDTPTLAPGNPGDLIRSQEFDWYDLPDGVRAARILYHSRSASGQDVPVSGVVLYPEAKPPTSGWPVIAWAHALSGVARSCAPSLARNLQHGPFLSMYVKLGYAVVATDYAGLGTSGRNAFLDAPSNATDVINSVPAARAAVPGLGKRWVAIGLAQGGTVALAIAELEHDLHDPNYLGSIAISGLDDALQRSQSPGFFYDMTLFLAYGIKTIDSKFEPKKILTAKAIPLLAQVEQSCSDAGVAAKILPSELLKPDWAASESVKAYFGRSELGRKPAAAPIMIISSELDSAHPIPGTVNVFNRLCRQGDRIEFDRYPQSDPASLFGDSVSDQISWIQNRFAGRSASNNCSGHQE